MTVLRLTVLRLTVRRLALSPYPYRASAGRWSSEVTAAKAPSLLSHAPRARPGFGVGVEGLRLKVWGEGFGVEG